MGNSIARRAQRQGKSHRAAQPGRRAVYAADWAIVYECSLRRWAKSESLKWGFSYRLNYRTDIHSRLKPWATQGRHLVAKICTYVSYEMCCGDADFKIPKPSANKWLVIVEEYCHSVVSLPDWYSLRGVLYRKADPGSVQIYDAKVIGSRDDHVVVQLVRVDWYVDVLTLHPSSSSAGIYTVQSVYSFRTKDLPYLLEATLSPDHRHMCLKPSWEFILSFSQHPEENVVMLIDLTTERATLRETLFPCDGTERVIAFDPRYRWRRLAIGSRQIGARGGGDRAGGGAGRGGRDDAVEEDIVYLYDLEEKTVVCRSLESQVRQTTHSLVFSPDGRFLASLVIMADRPGWYGFVKVVDFILVYSSDSLAMLLSVPCTYTPAPINLTSMACFPLFSRDGRYLCLQIDNLGHDYGWKVKVITTPMSLSLQHICRLVIRSHFSEEAVRRLHLPTRLKDYIQFRPYI